MDDSGHSRTCEHCSLVLNLFGLDVAWDEYGMAGKCIVRSIAIVLTIVS